MGSYASVVNPPARAAGSVRDQTDVDQAARLLERTISPVLFRAGRTSCFTLAFPSFLELFGLPSADVAADLELWTARVHPEDLNRLVSAMLEGSGRHRPVSLEYRYRHPTKGEVWIETRAIPERLAGGDLQWIGFSVDATERKRNETEWRLREEEFRALAENAPDPIVRYDRQLQRIYANPPAERLCIAIQPRDLPGPGERIADGVRRVLASGETCENEIEFVDAEGRDRCFVNRYVPERNSDQEVVSVLSHSNDISEHRRIQSLTEKNERKFRAIAENTSDCIGRVDAERRVSYLNPRFVTLLGVPETQCVGRRLSEAFPDSRFIELDMILEWVMERCRPTDHYVSLPGRDGIQHYHLRLVPERNDDGPSMGVLIFGNDITQHRRFEDALLDSRSLLHGVIDAIADGVFVRDRHGRWLHVNEAFCRLVGRRRDDLLGQTGSEGFSEDLAGLLGEGDAVLFETGVETTAESELALGQGKMRRVRVRKRLLSIDHGETILVGTLSDVTEQRRMEGRLRKREQGFRSLAENSPDVIVRYDRECRRLYANPAWERANGISRKDVIGRLPTEISVRVKAIAPEYEAWLREVMDTNTAASRDITWMNDAGEPVCFAQTATPEIDGDGNVTSVLTVARDVSALRNAERWMMRFVARVPGYLFTFKVDPRGGSASMPFVSPGIKEVAGIDPERACANLTELLDLVHPDDRSLLLEIPRDSSDDEETRTISFRLAHPTRGVRWLESYVSQERSEDGCILLHGMTLDVTDRKRIRLELEKGEREFRTLAENSPDNVVRYDRQCRAIFANRQHADLIGMPVSAYLGKTPLEMHPDGLYAGGRAEKAIYQATLEHVIATGEVRDVEMTLPGPAGSMLTHLVRLAPERDENGQIVGALAFGRDITERKHHEQMLQAYADVEKRLSHCVASTPGFFFTLVREVDGRYHMPFASSGITDIFGLRPAEVEAEVASLAALFHPDDEERILLLLDESARTLTALDVEFRVRNPEKGDIWVEARAVAHREADGRMEWHGFMHDDTHRKSLEGSLRERESEFRALVENAADPICRYDRDGRRIYANVVSLALLERIHEASQGAAHEESTIICVRRVVESGQPAESEFELSSGNGGRLVCQARFVPELAEDGSVASVLSIGRDVTALKESQGRLEEAQAIARVGHWEWDFSQDRAFLSAEACRILGKPKGWAPTIRELLHIAKKADRAKILRHLQRAYRTRQSALSYECEIVVDGERVDIASHGRIEYADGGPVRMIVTTQDVTREREYERRLHDLAFLDPLTGLANRALFHDRLSQTIARAAREKSGAGVMVVDLDRFKIVNDSLGHSAGDILLQEIGIRLLSCLRETDTVARMGGDEFAIILPDLRSDVDVGSVANKVLAELERPVIIDGRDVFVTSSIGIATYPRDGVNVAELLSFADMAMYHAKGQGKNTFQFYSEELRKRSTLRLTTETLLRGALSREELQLNFQAQVDLSTRCVVGAEALLRWNNSQLGLVQPVDFIGIAEDTGLILDIGEWVFRSACQAAVEWNRPGRRPIRVAVNLSPRQFRAGGDLVRSIRSVMDETGCSPTLIDLEITESLLFDDFERARVVLRELHEMGFAIALDDFGTGHSILGYLKRFPVDQLKIDRSFLQGVPACPDGSDLIRAIISMARTLRLGLVAEGVETDGQAEFLEKAGCSLGQGFLFGKPMERRAFEATMGLRGRTDG